MLPMWSPSGHACGGRLCMLLGVAVDVMHYDIERDDKENHVHAPWSSGTIGGSFDQSIKVQM
jgi:hypothetical protein